MTVRNTMPVAVAVVLALAAAACGADGAGDSTTTRPLTGEETTSGDRPDSVSSLPLATEPSTTSSIGDDTTTDGASPAVTDDQVDPTPNPTPSSTSVPASATTMPEVVDWSNVVPAEVVAVVDEPRPSGARLRAWLLRFDDRLTLQVAQGMALEALEYGIVDADGVLERFADSAWIGDCDGCLRPEDVGGAATLMEVLLIGGYFGQYGPDPSAPDGSRLVLRTFSGVLASEPPDQIDYLVGSARLGPLAVFEERIATEVPTLGRDEYLAAVGFEHACGRAPAGTCR